MRFQFSVFDKIIKRKRSVAMRFGIVGFGIMGKWYGRIISESDRAQLVAVTSASESSRKLANEIYGVNTYEDAGEMYEMENLDAVYIATPDFLHFDFAREALLRDINVLLEKPMTMDVSEARELVRVERESDAIGTIRFGNRFSPPFLKTKAAILDGRLGEVISLNARLNDTIYVPTKMLSWSAKTTPAWFLMSHLLDLAYYLTGRKPTKVLARGIKKILVSMGIDTYDVIHAMVEYEGGGTGIFETGWILPESMPSVATSFWEIVGSKSAVFIDLSEQMLTFASSKYEKPGTIMVELNGKLHGYLVYMLELFMDAVEGKIPNPVPFEDGLLNVLTLDAVHRAIETNSWVEVDELNA